MRFCEKAILPGILELSNYWEVSIFENLRGSMEPLWYGSIVVHMWESWDSVLLKTWLLWIGFCLWRYFANLLTLEPCIEECSCMNIVLWECSSPISVLHSRRNPFPETHFPSFNSGKHAFLANMLSCMFYSISIMNHTFFKIISLVLMILFFFYFFNDWFTLVLSDSH